MAGEEHRRARGGPLAQHLARALDGGRVEAGERLVEHQHVRAVHQRGGELDALLVAEAELLYRVAAPVAQAEPGQPQVGRAVCVVGAHAVQLGEVDQLVEHAHPRVEPALLGQVADPPAGAQRDRLAVHAYLAGVRGEHAEHDAHGGGLAGAVAPDEAEDLSGRDAEADVAAGHDVAEAPGYPVHLQYRWWHACPPSLRSRPTQQSIQGRRPRMITGRPRRITFENSSRSGVLRRSYLAYVPARMQS